MDPFGDPWLLSPNGSGAQDAWPEESLQHDTFAMGAEAPGPTVVQDEDEAAFAVTYGASDLPHGQVMSTKIPPALLSWNQISKDHFSDPV